MHILARALWSHPLTCVTLQDGPEEGGRAADTESSQPQQADVGEGAQLCAGLAVPALQKQVRTAVCNGHTAGRSLRLPQGNGTRILIVQVSKF